MLDYGAGITSSWLNIKKALQIGIQFDNKIIPGLQKADKSISGLEKAIITHLDLEVYLCTKPHIPHLDSLIKAFNLSTISDEWRPDHTLKRMKETLNYYHNHGLYGLGGDIYQTVYQLCLRLDKVALSKLYQKGIALNIYHKPYYLVTWLAKAGEFDAVNMLVNEFGCNIDHAVIGYCLSGYHSKVSLALTQGASVDAAMRGYAYAKNLNKLLDLTKQQVRLPTLALLVLLQKR